MVIHDLDDSGVPPWLRKHGHLQVFCWWSAHILLVKSHCVLWSWGQSWFSGQLFSKLLLDVPSTSHHHRILCPGPDASVHPRKSWIKPSIQVVSADEKSGRFGPLKNNIWKWRESMDIAKSECMYIYTHVMYDMHMYIYLLHNIYISYIIYIL